MYQLEEISIELTNSCPMACMHCSSGSAPLRLPNELTYAEHVSLLDQARELGATVFSLSGGEPLNYEPYGLGAVTVGREFETGVFETGLIDLVNHAVKIGYEQILLYTTGYSKHGSFIYNYPHYEDLLGLKEMTWIFSLHSHNSITNDTIMRRSGTLNVITSSIEALVKAGETVEIHMVPMKPNFRDIETVRLLCKYLGVSKMSCLRFVPQIRGKEHANILSLSKAEFAEMQFILHKEMERNRDHPVELRLGCPIDFRHSIGMLPEKRKQCHAGDDLMLIRPTGDVHPCAAWKSLPADSNVRRTSLKSIWLQSEVFNAIRNFKYGQQDGPYIHAAGYRSVGGSCERCAMLESCITGCPAQRLHAQEADQISALYAPISDPLCPRGDTNNAQAW